MSGGVTMNHKLMRNLLEWLVIAFLIAGIVSAALNVTFSGFTPMLWFLLAIVAILIIICSEVTLIRESLERKK
jgi:hypothetical protein